MKPRGPEAVAQQDPNRIVATIDGKQITAKQAVELLKPLGPEDRKKFDSNLQSLIQQLYMTDQIAVEAAKMNLDQQSPWKEQLQMARANILTRAYLNKMATSTSGAPAEDPQQYYNAHLTDFDQVRLSGILVAFSPPGTPANSNSPTARTEAQAQDKANDLEKKIKAGSDFAAVARTDSDNQTTSVRGGDLGTIVIGEANLPADIKSAIEKLQPGQVSEPVRITAGFYILKLESRSRLPFEQAKAGITQKLQNEKGQAVLKQEMDKYKVQVQDPDFFSASAPPVVNTPTLQRPAPAQPPAATPKPQGK